jgi:CRP-like cAMP-binding protein
MPRSDAPGHAPPLNRLLAALPPSEYAQLRPFLEPVALTFKAVLYEPGQVIPAVYFPVHGVLSLICPAEGKAPGVEVGVIGREGMTGLPVLLGTGAAFVRCIVQVPGDALRMRAEDFRKHVAADSYLHTVLLRYTHFCLAQLAHSVNCNSLHAVEQRLCRWLLATHDRAGVDRFPLTHEFLAAMLGVRRASVTVAARQLRDAGWIRYGAGELTVLNRRGLEAACCSCYGVVQAELERVFV